MNIVRATDTTSRILLIAASVTSLVLIGLLWAMQSPDRVCIAIYPPPPECGPTGPQWVQFVGIGAVLVLLSAHVVAYFTASGTLRVTLQWIFTIAAVVAFAVCALAVLTSLGGGFSPPYPVPVE